MTTFEIGETDDQRRERLSKAVEFAGRYVRSFDRELLNLWHREIVEHTLPPTASHAELAADNALRAFVVGILRQYQFALTGSFDTPWQQVQQTPAPQQRPRQPKQQQRPQQQRPRTKAKAATQPQQPQQPQQPRTKSGSTPTA